MRKVERVSREGRGVWSFSEAFGKTLLHQTGMLDFFLFRLLNMVSAKLGSLARNRAAYLGL